MHHLSNQVETKVCAPSCDTTGGQLSSGTIVEVLRQTSGNTCSGQTKTQDLSLNHGQDHDLIRSIYYQFCFRNFSLCKRPANRPDYGPCVEVLNELVQLKIIEVGASTALRSNNMTCQTWQKHAKPAKSPAHVQPYQ